jgi:hypothetical protein
MAVVRLQAFGGAMPVSGDRALPDGFAVESVNTWLYSQELRGQRPPAFIKNMLSTTRRVMRIPQVGAPPSDLFHVGNVWKEFVDHDTDVVLSPTVNDSFRRIYWASPTTGPRMNTYANLTTNTIPDGYKLGVVGPVAGVGIPSIDGGAAPVVTRSYVYTYVSIYGEESKPSPPSNASGNASGTWQINGIADPPADATRSPMQKKILYRTITSSSGVATFFKVTDIALGTTTWPDSALDTVVAGNLQLESTTWEVPPATLQGMILMPNGFLIGWVDKTIHFSESFRPHAWPPEYQITVEYPVVGLGVQGTTCVVCTQGYPTAITGTKPVAVSVIKSTSNEPCLGRGSIVSTPQGVIYASQNGLIVASSAGMQNITEKLITREEWVKNYAPQTLRAARYQNGYLAMRMIADAATRTAFYLDPTALQVALTELSEFANCRNVFPDIWSGDVLIIQNDKIYQWDPPSNDLLPVLWRSKEFQFPKKMNMAVYSIYWDDARFASNAIGTDIIASDVKTRFRVFADRQLIYDQPVPKNGQACRLPSGFKADIWQFEIRARAPVYSCHVATTERELVQV